MTKSRKVNQRERLEIVKYCMDHDLDYKVTDPRIPNMTPHTFRYTFCINMANRGMNQYIMGHFNITMTLGYYAHSSFVSAKAEMERLSA